MRYLAKTLQVQNYFNPLVALIFARNMLVASSVILATWTFFPHQSTAEVSTLPHPNSSEPLTFNYSFAKGEYRLEHSIDALEVSNQREPTGPLEVQSVGSLHDNPYFEHPSNQVDSTEGRPHSIIDEPASLNDEGPAQQDSNPSHSEAITLSHNAHVPAAEPEERIASSFNYVSQGSQTRSSKNFLPKLRFNAADSSEQQSQVFLARFARVFDPTWEAPQQRRSGAYGTLPLVLNEAVEKNLEYFQYGIPERFQTYLDRFHHYQDLVEPVFRELGLPPELMYLSLVESGFNPRAFSRSRASGPWQFMKGTGLVYGLDVDWYLDERRDPIKSTVAAAHHLRDLYDQFGSWPLALAAYNAGSGKISRAIKKTGTRDFWTIRRSRHIRRETKEYVPRFIAATLIAQNPMVYGFSSPDGDRHEFEEVLITKRIHLSAVTQQTGIPVEELQRLNPELRRSIVPSLTGPGYSLKVPLGMASLVEEHHPKLVVWTQPPPPPTEWYQVRRGESLSVVAKRFGMKVSQLKDMNNLSSNIIRVGTKLRVRGGVGEDDSDTEITWYRVRSGDSLGNIATRFRMSVNTLMRLNSLSSHTIYPGDRLRVKGEPASASSNNDSKWYKVRQGDSLWTIAKQFRVSVKDLRALNNLSSSIIQAGHMLMVSQ
jgi:membrane-bound lytic murein transglycosylase D